METFFKLKVSIVLFDGQCGNKRKNIAQGKGII